MNLLICTLNFIEKMLLLEKIEIFDIPYELRIKSTSFYITACRVYRNTNILKYQDVLNLLDKDIKMINKESKSILVNLKKELQSNMDFFGA